MTDKNLPIEAAEENAPDTGFLLELAGLCEKRAATYSLLARLHRIEIDEDFLEELKEMRFPASTGNAKIDSGYRLILKYLSGLKADSITELAVDFARVYIGHGVDGFSAAYPYESVYTSEKRLLMQEARGEVLAIYRSFGLDKHESWKESEDHLAVELEFMQFLCLKAADALREDKQEDALSLMVSQKNFLEDHLSSWVPMMTADMRRFAHTSLYQGLADWTDGLLENEKEFLNDILADDAC